MEGREASTDESVSWKVSVDVQSAVADMASGCLDSRIRLEERHGSDGVA